MRLAHLRGDGALRLVVRTQDGWTDVASVTGDDRCATLSGLIAAGESAIASVSAIAAVRSGIPDDLDGQQLGPVVDDVRRIFCVGRNYVEHRDEFDNKASPWPEVFLRLPTSVAGPFDDIICPSVSERVDFEGEMAVVIGQGGRHIDPADALSHVFAATVANDVSMRDWQKRGGQWTAGKNFDASLPIGPTLVTVDELDPTDLALETRLNGEVVQSSRTSQFIFDLPAQIAFISSWTALVPGDVIVTGTPGGVGDARTPPLRLGGSDVVEVSIEGIGTIRNRFVDDPQQPVSDHWRDVANGREGSAIP